MTDVSAMAILKKYPILSIDVLIARGHFYSPLEKSEPKEFDAFVLQIIVYCSMKVSHLQGFEP